MRVTLTKHHGLGNDFLVVFDDQPLPRLPLGGASARAGATAGGGSAPTACSSASPRRRDGAPTSAWRCSTPTAAGPR